MQVISKTKHPRSLRPKPSIEFNHNMHSPHIFQTPRRESTPIQTTSRLHYAKRQTCPVVMGAKDHIYPSPKLDQNCASFKASTQAVFDSRKTDLIKQTKQEWKILTLQQIQKQRKNRMMQDPQSSSRYSKSGKKLHVSISKSNRSSTSKQSKQHTSLQPRLKQLGRTHSVLNSLNCRTRIVDTVELQMDQKVWTNRFLC